MMKLISLLPVVFIAIVTSTSAYAASDSTVGWVERVHLDDINASFPAKLDTGAKTSSVDAEIMKLIEPKVKKDGEHGYAVFSIKDENDKPYVVKRKIERWVRIKKKAQNSGFVRRPVVRMAFCISDRLVEEEVNLADRNDFIYSVLVGRNMLAKAKVAVDAGSTFTTKPACVDSQ